MKNFYDRESELEHLRQMQHLAYTDHSRYVVLTGRRRVGKTRLVYRLMQESEKEAPGIYFFVARKTESVLLQTFVEEARQKLDEFIPEGIRSFRELFQFLLEIGKRRCFTIFIDEFQEFENINPGIFSDIQELWDKYKHDTHVCLIVSGSIFRLMEKIFKEEQQPLFGRDDCTIKLQPFRTDVLREILGDHNPDYSTDDLLALWTITGGVARYVELLMDNGSTTVEKMIRYVCSTGSSFFIDEGRNILLQEFGKQYGTYFSILGQIAQGDVTQRDIESALDKDSLGGHLKMLDEKYGIISKKRPIGAKPTSQTVRYEIRDNFFRFWFRYCHRYSSLIELQNMSELERIIRDDYTTFSGVALERWFRQRMIESSHYKQIGSWWLNHERYGKPCNEMNEHGHADEFEIDIVAVSLEDEIEACEVKRNKGRYNPRRLEEKVAMMQRHLFRGKIVKIKGLSMDDMESIF